MTRAEIFELKKKKKCESLARNNYRGKGSTQRARDFIESALGKECPYCGRVLTLNNLELDHKVPLMRTKIKKNEYTAKELELLNDDSNKGPICNVCNAAKGELNDYEFAGLIDHLKIWEKSCDPTHWINNAFTWSSPESKLLHLVISPNKATMQYVLSKMKSAGLRFVKK